VDLFALACARQRPGLNDDLACLAWLTLAPGATQVTADRPDRRSGPHLHRVVHHDPPELVTYR